ncbi:MAG: extracellular solute-binding protein [Candidatus Hydrogenedentes bacterium]|nr:extracellular solute-binding protein [Candidatus Hydrogenedentota bacterium]
MKYVFAGSFLAMIALSAVAWWWQPREVDERIPLVWCCDDAPIRREQIALFNQLHPKYRLMLDPQNGQLEKVIVQSLAGVGPDIFDCYYGWGLDAFVRSGIALDCTDEFARRGTDIDEVWPCVKKLSVYEGRVYGHPGNAHAPAVWFNKQLFDEAGVPYPSPDWTWDDFIEIAKRLTKRDERGRPLQLGFIGYWEWKSVVSEWGGHIFNPEGTRCLLDSPEAIAALQFMQDLTYKHHVAPSLSGGGIS